MKSTFRLVKPPLLKTKQSQDIIKEDVCHIVSNQFPNSCEEQELIQKWEDGLKEDLEKSEDIKAKLINTFFNLRRKKASKQEFRRKQNLTKSVDNDKRRKLETEIKNSLSIVLTNRVSTPKRYSYSKAKSVNSSPMDISTSRPQTSPYTSPFAKQPEGPSTRQSFNAQLNNIIDESRKISKYKTVFQEKNNTSNYKQNYPRIKDRRERLKIMDTIISKDVDDYMKYSSLEMGKFNPEFQRQKYEANKKDQLSNFEKYNMTFVKFIKEKTISNIERSIYNQKIRQKSSYVQKFQKQILDESKFTGQGKNRLLKVFEGIDSELQGRLKNREASQRMKKK